MEGDFAKTAEKLRNMPREHEASISDIKKRLFSLLEEAKEPVMGMGRTEYTIDGWKLHDMIKGFANAL